MNFNQRTTATAVREPTQFGFNTLNPPKTQLVYRGNTYNYTPPLRVICTADRTNWPTVTLTYRGTTYERKIQPARAYRKPRAINWRWQLS
jgi:hypothetical protein